MEVIPSSMLEVQSNLIFGKIKTVLTDICPSRENPGSTVIFEDFTTENHGTVDKSTFGRNMACDHK